MDSKIASRKLGYGFSSEYQEIPLSEFVVNAKKELETVPKFDPWRLISVERKKKKLFDRQTKEDAVKDEKSFLFCVSPVDIEYFFSCFRVSSNYRVFI